MSAAARASGSGLVLLGAIAPISFAVSADHVHQLFVDNGQGGWVAVALTVVVELLALGSGLEFARRIHRGESPALPAVLFLMGVAMTLWGNLASAGTGAGGVLVAAFPAVCTLLILLTIETARVAAASRRAEGQAQDRAAREAQREAQAARAAAARLAQERAAAEVQAHAEEAQRAAAAEVQRVAQEVARRAEVQRSTRRSAPVQTPSRVTVDQAAAVALSHRTERGELPSQSQLVTLSGASLSTCKRALAQARQTPVVHLVKNTG